jgi:ABC-type transport system substrate-binding protein
MPRPAKLLVPSVVPIAAENLSSPCPLCLLRARRLPRATRGPGRDVKSFSSLLLTSLLLYFLTSFFSSGCSRPEHADSSSLTLIIESNPTNLDPRFATDTQSQHIDGLLFSSLLERDNQMNLHGDLAESWDLRDPLTYVLRWVGANTDPDIFEFVYSTKRFPPDGANRGHYRNARIDALTDQIRVEMDKEKRKALCSEVQKILADDLPYLPLWFRDVVSVHRRSLGDLHLSPTGDFDFLSR